jgi:hypothetical protein
MHIFRTLRKSFQSEAYVYVPFSITTHYVLRHAHSLVQSEFSRDCDLVLPVSISHIFSFLYDHLLAAYIFFLVFSSLLYFMQYRTLEQFQSSWPSFFRSIACRVFPSSLTYVTSIPFHTLGALTYSILPQHHISKRSVYCLQYASTYNLFFLSFAS